MCAKSETATQHNTRTLKVPRAFHGAQRGTRLRQQRLPAYGGDGGLQCDVEDRGTRLEGQWRLGKWEMVVDGIDWLDWDGGRKGGNARNAKQGESHGLAGQWAADEGGANGRADNLGAWCYVHGKRGWTCRLYACWRDWRRPEVKMAMMTGADDL